MTRILSRATLAIFVCLSPIQSAVHPIWAAEPPAIETPGHIPGTTQTQTLSQTIQLEQLHQELQKKWPENRMVRIVFHGHSVPAGYFRTPAVRTFDAYPSLFHRQLCDRYPTAVIDVSVTAIGGEDSISGAQRFERDVLSLRPDLVFIDYSLNDRRVGLEEAAGAWRAMIRAAQRKGVPVVLLTPTPDTREDILDDTTSLAQHARQVRDLGDEFGLPVVDSYAAFARRARAGEDIEHLMAQGNHPNREGHQIVAEQLIELVETSR
ncbi:SGNH/GDSL hydrolase family protein [Allorhodopirellula solitaria]|uniref:SGNH hydrolase-type esterase domain-containing protein n=1 Tax=Allorhodopirellula solitaria TaxID=2527987 RepID=A0A5C5YFA8_9BACT|nr:SGNH/GDSL hydrolase family protein [Allorhodopirellula solitaria]TWT74406.1 hypothetical protein CA85_12950 [Allorhodopirellula solitaria]